MRRSQRAFLRLRSTSTQNRASRGLWTCEFSCLPPPFSICPSDNMVDSRGQSLFLYIPPSFVRLLIRQKSPRVCFLYHPYLHGTIESTQISEWLTSDFSATSVASPSSSAPYAPLVARCNLFTIRRPPPLYLDHNFATRKLRTISQCATWSVSISSHKDRDA